MTVKQEIQEYLTECGMFFFSTVKDGAPVTRPLGFHMLQNGELYFGVGTFKEVYAQITANPNVYLCAAKPDKSGWLRISAKAVCDDDPALVDACFQIMSELKGVYDANGWTMGIFPLEDATVTFVEGFMGATRAETF